MAGNDRLLWKRPDGCTCKAKLRGDDANNGTSGDLRLTREVDAACPLHGIAEDMMGAALDAAEGVIATVPGVPRIARPQLRRMVLAALPIIQAAVASGTFPMPTTPPATPPANPLAVDPTDGDPSRKE